MSLSPRLYLFAAWLLFPVFSFASDSVELGVDFSYFDYKENGLTGQLLDTEQGALYGVYASYTISGDDRVISVEGRLNKNTIAYDGVTNSGNRLSTTTDETLFNFQLRYDHLLHGLSVASSLYAGLGYRQWWRDIQSIPVAAGLLETYRWPYLMTGVVRKIQTGEHVKARIELGMQYSILPRIDVGFLTGAFDSVTVEQGNTWGLTGSVSFLLGREESKQWTLTPYIDYWHSQRGDVSPLTSAGVTVGTVIEPQSRTLQSGVRWGFSF